MKRISLCILFTSITMISCTNDETTQPERAQRPIEQSMNPYEITGRLHAELSEEFILGGFPIVTTQDVLTQVELLANSKSEFVSVKPATYSVNAQRIVYLLEERPGRIGEIIAMSPLSWKAKISLTNYINTLVWNHEQAKTPDEIITFINEYESSILSDASFTETDRRILLTTVSICRSSYDMQRRKVKRRDRDWELSIGNFLTSAGSGNGAEAITMSVVAGLLTNK